MLGGVLPELKVWMEGFEGLSAFQVAFPMSLSEDYLYRGYKN